jgi:signal transduction histidine kinase/DNA-binding response OmpR family regulator
MPEMDGYETAALIRRRKKSAHTPIIFITAYADEVQTAQGYSLGAVDYILSPVVPDILRSKVKVFVELHLLQRRLARHADERVALAAAEAARAGAEANRQRSERLARASRDLGESLHIEVAVERFLEALVPSFAAAARVVLFGEEGRSGLEQERSRSDADGGTAVAGRERRRLFPAAPDVLQAVTLAETSEIALPDGARALALAIGGRVLGGLLVRPHGPDADWPAVRELTARAAVAFENALLYRKLQLEIDERRGIETQLNESNRRKDEFLAMLSHELRNPLAPIRTAIEVIRRVAPKEPKLEWALDVSSRQIGHLNRLVEDLLDVARINQGKIALQSESLDLRAAVETGVETARPFIEGRRHRLVCTLPETPVWLRGDAARLAQVVSNLLNNAAKYTEDGGRIELALSVQPDGHALIEVVDNGIGIDAALLPAVFELFEQGSRSLARSEGGLGVGLTLVRRIVELHHGTVEAASDGVGRGSRFSVRLPCLSEALPASGAAQAEARLPEAGCRVLVVDDNQDAAEAAAVFLALAGHEAKAVLSGVEALASAAVFVPDVIFLDIGLPGMDGFELARRLRAIPETRASLYVALTGYGQPGDRLSAREAGFDHHLTKPADPNEVLELIAAWRSARQAAPRDEPAAGAAAEHT